MMSNTDLELAWNNRLNLVSHQRRLLSRQIAQAIAARKAAGYNTVHPIPTA
jgi:hypothetical protein